MAINFKKLRWKNLLSTGNIFTEIELNKHNTTLIVGENGAGKSTILDALSYALFGKPFRKINKTQLLNSITQKGLLVEVEFTIGTQQYMIRRGMKPTVFEVYQNEKLLNQSAEMKDYQEILEKQILKVNHRSFCQVVVLGSATFQPFMQLPAGQRREIIEELLELQIFTTMNSLLKNKVMINNEEVTRFTADKKIAEEKIKMTKSHLLEMQNNNDQLIEEKKKLIEETNVKISDYLESYIQLEKKISGLQEQTVDKDTFTKKVQKLNALRVQIETNLKNLNKEVEFFSLHDNCPTCKQTIDEQFKCETVASKDNQIKEIESGLEQLTKQYEEASERIKEIMEIEKQITAVQMDMMTAKAQINSLELYVTQLKGEIEKIKVDTNTEGADKLAEYEAELELAQGNYTRAIEERDLLGAAAVLLKDGGIKAKIIKQYIPIINKLINKYLSSMEFMCQFELDENFNEIIKSRFRDEFSYASFSEGEKMRINLAILFTWRAIAKLRNSINTNILIMDEVFDSSLDANGTEEFLKIINTLTSDTNTIIISHKTDQLYDKFEKVIKFEKHKNFSRMVS